MPSIDGNTLMMAIQAVDAKITFLCDQIDTIGEDGDATDYEDELLAYTKAAAALKLSYEEALKSSSNLPIYENLGLRNSVDE
jgi:hypothetical protein